ncbi:Uncharacterized protein HZ326_2146 [Fusarium oxysporum f. sp. albedinis]|nr:Uncharacterized protein HZ326_2146 [Fusarium oxysporum f. sp. albedinis]
MKRRVVSRSDLWGESEPLAVEIVDVIPERQARNGLVLSSLMLYYPVLVLVTLYCNCAPVLVTSDLNVDIELSGLQGDFKHHSLTPLPCTPSRFSLGHELPSTSAPPVPLQTWASPVLNSSITPGCIH